VEATAANDEDVRVLARLDERLDRVTFDRNGAELGGAPRVDILAPSAVTSESGMSKRHVR
jgi:hypothetical protein